MRRLLSYYNFVVCGVMVLVGFTGARSYPQLLSAMLFYPLAVYFSFLIIPQRKRALKYPAVPSTKPIKKKLTLATTEPEVLEPEEETEKEFDLDRRAFIKLIGSAGLSVFLLSIFTKKAQAAFFGSVPGPGTVAIKDSTGALIDPAEKQPTDGYKISQLDDSTATAYYGFTNKNGAWFILRDASGEYRYAVGSTNFSVNWTGKADLSYSRYEDVF